MNGVPFALFGSGQHPSPLQVCAPKDPALLPHIEVSAGRPHQADFTPQLTSFSHIRAPQLIVPATISCHVLTEKTTISQKTTSRCNTPTRATASPE